MVSNDLDICPYCGGKLTLDESILKYVCGECEAAFEQQEDGTFLFTGSSNDG